MGFGKHRQKKLLILVSIIFIVIIGAYIQAVYTVPGSVTLIEGKEHIYHFKSPFMVNIIADKKGAVVLNNEDIKANGYYNLYSPLSFKSENRGCVNLKLKILGLLPLKTMQVYVVPDRKIAACGNTIGVKIDITGILVLGTSDVQTIDGSRLQPARDSGIRTGDFLVEMNGEKLTSIDVLINQIESCKGKKIKLKYERDGHQYIAEVTPVKSIEDKKNKIGLWVRDSTAGIGTLTFYDPQSGGFGALGHGITDMDTGILMPIREGDILESNILAVKKGQQGSPGELKGVFIEDGSKIGTILKNSECGVYGIINRNTLDRIPAKLYPVALRSQIVEGSAKILANIDGKKVEEFDITIERISLRNYNSPKSMVIRITDERLLDITGGIVQGMSGSPIIQNGKLIGAVTHVLINDPSRGYGIFIEWMINNLNDVKGLYSKRAG